MTARKMRDHGVTETFTGKAVDAFDLRVEDICIEDVAHHLSLECRFAGACRRAYSVAEHSLLVLRFVRDVYGAGPEVQLAALMHDAFEAYAKDIPAPQKSKIYKLAEARGMEGISAALGFEYPHPQVALADRVLCWLEADALLPSRGVGWTGYDIGGAELIAEYGRSVHVESLHRRPLPAAVLEEFFLRAYHELVEAVQQAEEMMI